jgi:hypothetical protein
MLALKHSLLNTELILINVLKALASIIFMCSLHVIILPKITQIFYVTDEVDIPSTAYNTSLEGGGQVYEKSTWPES